VSTIEEIEDALAGFAIESGFPAKRRVLAGELMSAGITAEDVHLLGQDCERTVEGEVNAVRVLYSRLRKPDDLEPRLTDLRKCEKSRSERLKPQQPYFGASLWQKPADPRDLERQQRYAYARLRVEGAWVGKVAEEMGVDAVEAGRLADAEGERRSRQPAVKAEAPKSEKEKAADASKRKEQIRQMLHQKHTAARGDSATKLMESIRKIPFAKARLAGEIKKVGKINLGRVLHDKVMQGAFAELENEGLVQTCGDIDDHGFIQCRFINDPAARDRLVAERKAYFIREMMELSTPAARSAARRAAANTSL
jgi:hypothetical protein